MDNVTGAIDVPLELFGGLNTELAPSDLPEGVSPANQDVAYLPGSVFQRPGLHRIYNTPLATPIYFFDDYVQPNEDPLTLFASANTIYKEDVNNSPGTYSSVGTISYLAGSGRSGTTNQGMGSTAFGRKYIAFSDGLHGTEVPLQYDGTNLDRVSQDGPGNGPSAADSAVAGSITAGQHQYVVMFQTRQGYITAPSPPKAWTAAGNFKVTLSGIPVGPPNVVARIIAFTGAGGDNFFYIPTSVTLPTPVSSTVINDNTTTSIDMDFSDNALFAATAIDVPGNNLFAQVVLGPCLGVFSYASRMFWWGERNKVQNFLNMGFDGGAMGAVGGQPFGWTHTTLTGSLDLSGYSGWALAFGSNSSWNQSAYQDYTGTAILQPNTQYSARFFCQSVENPSLINTTLTIDFYSPSQGVLASAVFNNVAGTLSTQLWSELQFSAKTPSQIPADTVLRLTSSGSPGAFVTIDELEIIYTDNPYRDNVFRVSYVNNPEAFDGVTGVLGPSSDPSALKAPFNQRNNLYIITGRGLHQTQDNPNSEPSGWTVNEFNQSTGGTSALCASGGDDWSLFATPSGMRIFEGGTPLKVSQEIQTLWNQFPTSNLQDIWVQNDPANRRCFIGMGGSTINSNKLLVLDYRELDTSSQIGQSGPIHISFSGKMISSDLTRKWTTWTIGTSYGGKILTRPGNDPQFCVSISTPNGSNLFYFDPAKLTDDDQGEIFPFYYPYFFINHDQEQQLQVGSHRKLAVYMTMYVTGVGYVNVTPYVDNLNNPWPALPSYPLSSTLDFDLEWGMNTIGNRVSFKIYPTPVTDTQNPNYTNGTDKYFMLNKMVLTMKQEPVAPVRGAI